MSIRFLSFFLSGFLVGATSSFAQANVFREDFEGVEPPAAPTGWVLNEGWETATGLASPGSGGNNLRHKGSQAARAVMPSMDLGTANFAMLRYFARRTGAYGRENLSLTASTSRSGAFSTIVLAPGYAAPVQDSRYEEISVALPSSLMGRSEVTLRFEGHGLMPSSSSVRIDDIHVDLYASDAPVTGTLAFSAATQEAGLEDQAIDVPLTLAFEAPVGLRGIQFHVKWTSDVLELADVIGAESIADTVTWSLSHETGVRDVDVVLLANGNASLPAGQHEALITLRFRASSGSRQVVSLSLSNVIGALATVDGFDAGLSVGGATHALTLAPKAFYSVPDTVYDVGDVYVGHRDSVAVTVSNPGGTTSLVVARLQSDNALFTARPASGEIEPNRSMVFFIRFQPEHAVFGYQVARIGFHHNGQDTPTTITVTGKGLGGRGDVEGDGVVDVLDVVHVLDFVLARLTPEPAQTVSADLFPFPGGDHALDVRDLAVLSLAIVRAQWPDDVSLPELSPKPTGTIADACVEGVPVGPGRYVLRLRNEVPMRGFQLSVPISSPEAFTALAVGGRMHLLDGYDGERGELRLVGYAYDGKTIGPGHQDLGVLTVPVGSLRHAVLVGENREQMAIDCPSSTSIASGMAPKPDVIPPPYPNPFRPRSGTLRFAPLPAGSEVDVFDVLGRRVWRRSGGHARFEWDGRDGSGRLVSPGLYIMRLRAGEIMQTWNLVIE